VTSVYSIIHIDILVNCRHICLL